MKKDIKLIAIDLDGTLINSDKVLTDTTKNALLGAIEKGAKVIPATGRAVSGLPDYLADLPLEYGIFGNGASVYDLQHKEELYCNRFTIEEALTIMERISHLDTIISFSADCMMYSLTQEIERMKHFNLRESTQDILMTTRIFVDDLEESIRATKDGVDKFVLFFKTQEAKAAARDLLNESGDYHVVSSLYENLEIGKNTCNKGAALSFLTNHLDLTPDQVMSFGDADNDCEMIAFAGTGVVMANGEESLKEIGDFITKSNNEDGVAYAIEKFMA